MKITIKDVAQKADVSIATVSRVINNKGYISEETRIKVGQAMKQLNYMPNIAARALQGKKTATIVVVLPSLDNPLYAELFQHIEKNLSNAHYQALLCMSNNQPQKEQNYFSLLKANQVEGIITSSHSEILMQQANPTYPIVCLDRRIESERQIPSVKSNNYHGGQIIANYVLQKAPHSVLILSGSKEDFYPVNDRIKGMLNIFNSLGVEVFTSGLDFESSLNIKKLLITKLLKKRRYDAICCTDDLTALIVLAVTDELNYHPFVTGYDGSNFINNFFPQLPTIQQPLAEMAELMCTMLLEKIKDPTRKFEAEYTFPIKLING